MHEHEPTSGLHLSARQWAVLLPLAIVFVAVLPRLAAAFQRDAPDTGATLAAQRTPYRQSEDYWLFEQRAQAAVDADALLVLGDSFVWGAYARADQTLPYHLSQQTGQPVRNLGFNGAHPAALDGIVRLHGGAIQGARVLLHANLLWMSSKRHDLSDNKESSFNHKRLVAQFDDSIAVYRASFEQRLSNSIGEHLGALSLARHWQHRYFDGLDLPSWTLEHPYRILPEPARIDTMAAPEQPRSWTERGIKQQSYSWIALEDSVQWRYLQSCIERLLAADNDVTVLLGPFNEHMLQADNRTAYRSLRSAALTWLSAHSVRVIAPDPLPSDLYADASHPLAAGYRLLATQIELPK